MGIPEDTVRRGNEALASLPREMQTACVVLGMRAASQGISRSLVQMGLMQAETADLGEVVNVIARMKVLREVVQQALGILREHDLCPLCEADSHASDIIIRTRAVLRKAEAI